MEDGKKWRVERNSVLIEEESGNYTECYAGNRKRAHLFAAAPALYEALKEAEPWLRNTPVQYQLLRTLDKVRAALSQAEGA